MIDSEFLNGMGVHFEVEPNTGCWLWLRGESHRYGTVHPAGSEKHNETAHRHMCALAVGPIPRGMCVCHRCDTPMCVNPAHLFVATHAENMRDCNTKGRRNLSSYRRPDAKSSRPGKLTPRSVRAIRRLVEKGVPQAQVAKAFDIDSRTVRHILSGETWNHVA